MAAVAKFLASVSCTVGLCRDGYRPVRRRATCSQVLMFRGQKSPQVIGLYRGRGLEPWPPEIFVCGPHWIMSPSLFGIVSVKPKFSGILRNDCLFLRLSVSEIHWTNTTLISHRPTEHNLCLRIGTLQGHGLAKFGWMHSILSYLALNRISAPQ